MTLEDFFTLTEMKDGLTAPSRVQELISVMQKEQDRVVKNAGDAMRQWAAVASTIAATENKDCIDLFIQLDGLWFINRSLKDAQNFDAAANDGFVEESITAMLQAVEKLLLDSEKSIASGIWVTLTNLLGHPISKVQDRARVLFDSWKGGGNCDAESHHMELGRFNHVSDKIAREESLPSAVNEAGNGDAYALGLVGGGKSQLRAPYSLVPEKGASVQIQTSDNVLQSSVTLDGEGIKERSLDQLDGVSTSAQEAASINKSVTTSAGSGNTPVPEQGSFKGRPDVLQFSNLSKKEKQEQNVNCPPEKLGAPEISLPCTNSEPEPVSVGASEAKKEPDLQHLVENNEYGVCDRLRALASDIKSGVDDIKATSSSDPQLSKTSENHDDCCSNVLQDSSVSGSNLGKPEVLEMSFSKTENIGAVKQSKGLVSNEGNETFNGSDSFKRLKSPRSADMLDKKSTDIELEYGIVDALEVARQVAQEVEREVHSSSSEKISEGTIKLPGSPDSIGKKDVPTCVPLEEVYSGQSHSSVACSDEKRNIRTAEPECTPDIVSSQVTEGARDQGGNSETSLCTFDLNEEVGSNDTNVAVNVILPVVSALKPAQTSGLPAAPLQFGGTLGWKGSAATSAFRPASPRKHSDGERNVSAVGNSGSYKQRQDCLDIDLNVAEGEEGIVKHIAESSALPSGQSSVELSPRRSIRLELDLNSVGDDGGTQPLDQMEGQLFFGRNGYWSPSPVLSSSSIQPSVRNIDLNDRPYLQTDLGDPSSHIIDAYGHSKSDAPVISILGAKVEVGRKENDSQTSSLPNGKAIEPVINLTMSSVGTVLGKAPAVSYNHSTVFGYNGLTSVPPLSFSSAMYGSGGTIPYMVDSRGAPVVPQVGGSSSTVLSSFSHPPFIISMMDTQHGLNGVGPSCPNFDLNASFMIDGGNRDTLAARQFFFPAQGRAIDDHGVGGKRKEPDGGWETYPFSYKHQQPPLK